MDIIKIEIRLDRLVAHRVAVKGKMLDGRGIEPAAVLAPELAERDGHELRRGAGDHIRQVDFEILAIAVELADEFLAFCRPV